MSNYSKYQKHALYRSIFRKLYIPVVSTLKLVSLTTVTFSVCYLIISINSKEFLFFGEDDAKGVSEGFFEYVVRHLERVDVGGILEAISVSICVALVSGFFTQKYFALSDIYGVTDFTEASEVTVEVVSVPFYKKMSFIKTLDFVMYTWMFLVFVVYLMINTNVNLEMRGFVTSALVGAWFSYGAATLVLQGVFRHNLGERCQDSE